MQDAWNRIMAYVKGKLMGMLADKIEAGEFDSLIQKTVDDAVTELLAPAPEEPVDPQA